MKINFYYQAKQIAESFLCQRSRSRSIYINEWWLIKSTREFYNEWAVLKVSLASIFRQHWSWFSHLLRARPAPLSLAGARGPGHVPGPRPRVDTCTRHCPPAGCPQWPGCSGGGHVCHVSDTSPRSSLPRQTWESKQKVMVGCEYLFKLN